MSWSLDGFVLPAICYADDVVLVAGSVCAAETMVEETIGKLKEVGLAVGAQKTHWTSLPKREHSCITVDGQLVVWETLEFVSSIVSLDGNARHAIAHRMAQTKHLERFNIFRWEDGVSSETDLQKTSTRTLDGWRLLKTGHRGTNSRKGE